MNKNIVFEIPEVSSGVCLNKQIFDGDVVTIAYHSGLKKLTIQGSVQFYYDDSFFGQEYYLMIQDKKIYIHSVDMIQKKDTQGITSFHKKQINMIPCYYSSNGLRYFENDTYLDGVIHFEKSKYGYTTYLIPLHE